MAGERWAEWVDVMAFWPECTLQPQETEGLILAAHAQCVAFAPALPAEVTQIPANYRMAEVLQARALYRAGASSQDQFGVDGATVTVFPMDWQVKSLLRPPSAPRVR